MDSVYLQTYDHLKLERYQIEVTASFSRRLAAAVYKGWRVM